APRSARPARVRPALPRRLPPARRPAARTPPAGSSGGWRAAHAPRLEPPAGQDLLAEPATLLVEKTLGPAKGSAHAVVGFAGEVLPLGVPQRALEAVQLPGHLLDRPGEPGQGPPGFRFRCAQAFTLRRGAGALPGAGYRP